MSVQADSLFYWMDISFLQAFLQAFLRARYSTTHVLSRRFNISLNDEKYSGTLTKMRNKRHSIGSESVVGLVDEAKLENQAFKLNAIGSADPPTGSTLEKPKEESPRQLHRWKVYRPHRTL